MASLPRPATGLKKHSMRPPNARAPISRTQSSTTSQQARSQSRAVSPAESTLSTLTNNTSRMRSPSAQSNGGTKRKEREFDGEGGEETNIHVVVRCRGRSDREVRENSGIVVSTNGTKGKSVELSMGPSALSNKTYHFDKVFSPAADQTMIYDDVVTPILDEMLQGYNCTIFAYGQTGTGKTYTMSGDMSDTLGLLSASAGIIPRVLYSLFSKLETEETESSVKCSFIELYNEELRDLLSVEENAKLKIFEDGQKKGHSATIVQGMEESHIKSASAGIRLLQSGSYRRQVAATKCNDLSSRSHTVFTVTVYTKRTADTGEDFVSAGKLNLVDLAGSENIQRSGAENKRATEAGLINKSLLTLGRVINALVDRSSHIPYRESKLTRLLQDSLGGRTKTCIIATVSPAKSNLEETISTLDYAFRAKNIRNKPQINQMVSKKTLLREFTAEIEKLKGELVATRQRNGVYLTNDNYEELTGESESRRILSEEQKAKIETLETNLRNKVQELFSLTSNFNTLKKDNELTRSTLDEANGVLEKTELVLADTRQILAEETLLRRAHQSTEEQLNNAGGELISTIERAVGDVGGLHAKVRRKSDLQSVNRVNWQSSQTQVYDTTQLLESRMGAFQTAQTQLVQELSSRMQGFINGELQDLQINQTALGNSDEAFEKLQNETIDKSSKAKDEMNAVLEEIKTLREDVKSKLGEGLQGLSAAAARISAEVINELEGFHTQLHSSYSSLGRDFKNIFEELVKHLSSQRSEADKLRRDLSRATQSAMDANAQFSTKLDTCLAEEREQAASDRKRLLSQITDMVNESGKQQDARLSSQMTAVSEDIKASRSDFQTADEKYSEGMEFWSKKETLLIEEVLNSREILKSKMKKDWTAVNDHNTSIQKTTRSVHEETVRIVDAQMKIMADQMRALDDFVLHARSHNEGHHSARIHSLQTLSKHIRQSNLDVKDHLSSASTNANAFHVDTSAQISALQSSLPSFTTEILHPLSALRNSISNTSLLEYVPTGETPHKSAAYNYPTTLPRTASHDTLLGKLARPSTTSPSFLSTSQDLQGPHLPLSPNKSVVYTDVDVFAPTTLLLPPPTSTDVADPRPKSSSSFATSTQTTTATTGATTESTGGLREVNVNVNAALFPARRSSEHLSSKALGVVAGKGVDEGAGMGPPPAKRQMTGVSQLKGSRKGEGRENSVVGGGRRLRSRGDS